MSCMCITVNQLDVSTHQVSRFVKFGNNKLYDQKKRMAVLHSLRYVTGSDMHMNTSNLSIPVQLFILRRLLNVLKLASSKAWLFCVLIWWVKMWGPQNDRNIQIQCLTELKSKFKCIHRIHAGILRWKIFLMTGQWYSILLERAWNSFTS